MADTAGMTQTPPDRAGRAAGTASQAVLIPAAGVLFDCDGVLVESDASVAAAWSRWAVSTDSNPAIVGDIVHGRRASDTVTLLIDPDQHDPAQALADINAYEVESGSNGDRHPRRDHAGRRHRTRRWAVVTSGNRILAAARLAAAGIPSAAVVVTADDVTDGKPHPEGYRAAAAQSGCRPSRRSCSRTRRPGCSPPGRPGVSAVIGVGSRALWNRTPMSSLRT